MNISRIVTLTHFSLIGFDGKSDLWKNKKNFPFLLIHRCPINDSHYPAIFEGDLWHRGFECSWGPKEQHSYSETRSATVVSTFKLADMAIIEYGDVRYVGRINFGFNQSVLALSILGIEGSEISKRIFTNSIKLYTNEPATKGFLKGEPLFQK